MSTHELSQGAEDWCTPRWIFDALNYEFDMDPCANENDFVPVKIKYYRNGLKYRWDGSIWLNPPFGKYRYQIGPWLKKFIEHGNGIGIVPNRTATEWWQEWANGCEVLIFMQGKVKFIMNGKVGKSPGYGNVLGAIGPCSQVLRNSGIKGVQY